MARLFGQTGAAPNALEQSGRDTGDIFFSSAGFGPGRNHKAYLLHQDAPDLHVLSGGCKLVRLQSGRHSTRELRWARYHSHFDAARVGATSHHPFARPSCPARFAEARVPGPGCFAVSSPHFALTAPTRHEVVGNSLLGSIRLWGKTAVVNHGDLETWHRGKTAYI